MTNDDKQLLLHFVTRTGMFINPVDIHHIHSFITGYETGRKNRCRFSDLSKELLSNRYRTKHLSDGLPGQVKRFAEKQSISRVVAFKRIALETIASSGLTTNMELVLKSRITEIINKINKEGHPWYNESWKEEWLSFVLLKQDWFKQLWTPQQLSVIRGIHKEVLNNNLFKAGLSGIPPDDMLRLKDRFEQLTTADLGTKYNDEL